MLLNLLPVEDYFLWCVRIHKPERRTVLLDGEDEEETWDRETVRGKGALFN